MEDSGPEAIVKRQRLDSYDNGHPLSHRTLQHPPAAIYGSGYPGNNAIPSPHHAYPRGPPVSPYHEVNPAEHRALPEPHPYPPTAPGYNTPGREPRPFPPDNLYSRPGSVSAQNQSPDGVPQYPNPRPPPIITSNSDAHRYLPHQVEHGGAASAYTSYENQPNGNARGLPMSTFSDANQGHPPGHVVPYSQSPIHPTPYPYSTAALDSPSIYAGVPKQRRGNRATQACDVCRNRKAKCNEGKPKCVYCTKEGLECVYQEVPPAKADRANQAILDQLADLQSEVQAQKIEAMQARQQQANQLDRIEGILSSIPSHLLSSTVYDSLDSDIKASPTVTDKGSPKKKEEVQQPEPITEQPALLPNREGVLNTVEKDPAVQRNPEFDVDPAIVRVEHTTAAHRLLSWPSVEGLIVPWPYSEHYVMRMEDAKGVLRVFGRGQGKDRDDGGRLSSINSSPSIQSDELPDSRSLASPPEGLWGTGLNTGTTTESLHAIRGTDGGLNQDGSLRVDILTLRRLLKSYLDNFHVMHPFMDRIKLHKWVNAFGLRYNARDAKIPFASSLNQTYPNFGRDSPTSLQRAGKRKHADGMHPGYSLEAPPGRIPLKPAFEKSIKSAIVFLIMALGMIAEHTAPLPGPAPDGTRNLVAPQKGYSPAATVDSPSNSVARQSTRSTSQSTNSTSAASPVSVVHTDHLTTSSKSPAEAQLLRQKNMDIIPGLAYFAQATEILGTLHGGNELVNVQAYILAGLYMGQLARPFESYSWLASACNVCRYLVRDPALNHIKDAVTCDFTRFAFWTCLQLESDILAELDLPQSGIKDITGVGYPVGYVDSAEGPANLPDSATKIMLFYSAQLQLRACLNEIQKNLYPPDRDHFERAKNPTSLRDAHHGTLEDWRRILPEPLKWHDSDPPSTDINHARLRAKYYGALYIIHRPFLRHALIHNLVPDDSPGGGRDIKPRFRRNRSSAEQAERPPGPMPPPSSISGPASDKSEILRSAHICVEAAVASSLAFDGIAFKKRLIVTNIFGTAHAQFGNMLVLSATFKSTLGYLIPETKLKSLYVRTLAFLRYLRQLSTTLEQDLQILERLDSTIFQPHSNNNSFSHDE